MQTITSTNHLWKFAHTPITSFSNVASFINKHATLIASLCIAIATGLSFLFYKYKWFTKPQLILQNNDISEKNAPTTNITQRHQQKKIKPNSFWWVQTNDNQLLLLDIEKNLPECSLQDLLKKYGTQFWHYNSTKTPLKIACSSSDIDLLKLNFDLLKKALHCINSDMENFNFTPKESAILLEISSIFKMQALYMFLLFSTIQTNNDINVKQITPALLTINEGYITLLNNVMTQVINKKSNTQEFPYINNHQRYKIIMNYLPVKYLFWDQKDSKYLRKQNDEGKNFSNHYNYRMFPHKKLVLFTWKINTEQKQKITPRIYDFENDKTYDLGINIIEVGHTAISPDEKYIALCSNYNHHNEQNGTIYLFDISDINNIKQYFLIHPKVYSLAFSPNSTMLISGACTKNGTLELWDIKKLNNLNEKTIKSRTLLHNVWCNNDIIFNKDNKHLAIIHEAVDLNTLTILNINNPTHNKTFNNIGLSFSIFKNNTDLIIYTKLIDDNSHALKIITKNGTKIYSFLCNTQFPTPLFCRISDNEEQIAISPSTKPLHLLTIKNEKLIKMKQTSITDKCAIINNDGSFWTRTKTAIRFYNPQLQCLANLDCKKEIASVKFSQNKHHIFCDHDLWNGATHWQLPDENDMQHIKETIDNMTPLQYFLINKACGTLKKHNALMSIQKNSLDHSILQSFGPNENLIIKTLKLQITDK